VFSRIPAWFEYLGYPSFMAVGSIYVAAASLIGFDMLAVMIGYATIWPVGAPIAIVAVGIYAIVRRRLRERRDRATEDR
jgi:hypothetical protein